jgi:hypothetical protein
MGNCNKLLRDLILILRESSEGNLLVNRSCGRARSMSKASGFLSAASICRIHISTDLLAPRKTTRHLFFSHFVWEFGRIWSKLVKISAKPSADL